MIGLLTICLGMVYGSDRRTMTVFIKEGHNTPIAIEAESNWKVRDLKSNIRQMLNPGDLGITHFNLNYNTKDITNQDETPLSDLGIGAESTINLIINDRKLWILKYGMIMK